MALAGRNYFDSLSGERQNQYREIYNKQRSLGIPSIEAMDYAQKNIMSIEGVKAPETVPSVNPAKTMMANQKKRKSFITGQDVQSYFDTNRQANLATDQDKAAAKWQPSKLKGREYFDTLTEPDQVALYQNTYNQARNNGMSSDDAMMKAQQATEGVFAQKANEGYRNILIGDKNARDDIEQLFGVNKFNQMDIPDQDTVLNAWEAGGIDSMIEAINSNGLNKKYDINVGWNPSANAFSFAPAPGEEEPFSLETGEQITPYDTTQQKFNNKRQELEAELSRLFKEDEQNLVELYLNADGELDTAWYDSEEEKNRAYQKFINHQRRQEIEKELEALDNQYNLERQQGLVNRDENAAKIAELEAQIDGVREEMRPLILELGRAQRSGDQEAIDRLNKELEPLYEKENELNKQRNDLDVTLKKVDETLTGIGDWAGKSVQRILARMGESALNALDTYRDIERSALDNPDVQRVMNAVKTSWDANGMSNSPLGNIADTFKSVHETITDDFAKQLEGFINDRQASAEQYKQNIRQHVYNYFSAAWKDGQFEKYNDVDKLYAILDPLLTATDWIEDQMGYQAPHLLINFLTGGSGEATKLMGLLSNPDFVPMFLGEYFASRAESYRENKAREENGLPRQELTMIDHGFMLLDSLLEAGIELYEGGRLKGGLESLFAGRGLSLLQTVASEELEEGLQYLKKGGLKYIRDDIQGRDVDPIFSTDINQAAVINTAELAQIGLQTLVSTTGIGALGKLALAPGRLNLYARHMAGENLTADEIAQVEETKHEIKNALEEVEAHSQFEQSVNGEDPETARDKPMPAREVARDIENNEGTTNEQTIPSEPGQELPEQGRRPAETRPTDQRKTYDEMTLEELQAEKERQDQNPSAYRPERKQALETALSDKEATAKVIAQTPEEYRRTLREQPRDIENNEGTDNPNNIPATYRSEEQNLPDVPRPEAEYNPELEMQQAVKEEGQTDENAAEQEAKKNPELETVEDFVPVGPDNRPDVPRPQPEQGPKQSETQAVRQAEVKEPEAPKTAAAEEGTEVTPQSQTGQTEEEPKGEGEQPAAPVNETVEPEEPAAPETTQAEENTEVEPQSKEGYTEDEPTDEGELPHAVNAIDQETEEYAKQYGFKSGATQGDGRNDTGVHLVSTGGNISENKTKVLQIIDRFAKHFGFSVEAYNGDPVENGFYRQGGRIVSINLNTENPFQTVLSHEAFHMVKSLSPKSAQQIEAIFDRYAAGAGFDVDHEIDLIIAQYARAGKLDSLGTTDAERRAGAKEELIANSMYSLLSDEQTMRRIYAEDRNLFQRIMDWVSKVQQSIQEMLNDYADNTPEARMLRDQQGALEELHKAMLDALEEMKALDDAKKAAVPVHGNGEMTRTYERAVNRANSKAQITEANRFLAGSVLSQTGNEVNNENIEKLYYAAQEVVGGAQPYYAMKNNGLSATGINDDTRRAMQMLGEYFQSVLRSGSNEEYSALMNGMQEQGVKYSAKKKSQQTAFPINEEVTKTYSQEYIDGSVKTQMRQHLDELNAMDIITDVNINVDLKPYLVRNKGNYNAAAEEYVLEQLKRYNGVFRRDGFPRVTFSTDKLNDNDHLSGQAILLAMAVPKIVRYGREINHHTNHHNRNIESWTFAGPISINGIRAGNMGVVVRFTQNQHRYYLHKAITPDGREINFKDFANKKEVGQASYQGSAEAEFTRRTSPTSNISVSQQDQEVKQNEQKAADQVQEAVKPLENDGLVQGLEGGTVVKNSLTTWWDTDKRKIRQQLKKAGFKTQDINKWIDDVESIAAMIAQDRDRLDYKASTVQTFLKDNAEYVKTLDSSTLCAKRRLYQGTFDAIQHALPNTVITSDMLIHLRNMMAERNYETPCGICYVESRRRNLGTFTERFIKNYEGDSTGYKPTMDDLTTMDGLEDLRTEHPEAYEAYRAAMAKTGSNNPKVVQPRTEYRGEILQLTPGQVEKIVEIGGLRVQSFSDFETPHLIDMMQAVLDMSEKKLTSQAYTKVPNFAAVFGGTGIKINLSLIADGTGLDENGNLVYSSYEGMDIKRALELRDQYPDDVGTILVGVSDQHILAAMASDDIDFIIPFHKSGWGKKQLEQLTAMRGYHDYTADQNERRIVGTNKNGKPKLKKVEENFHPVDYWDYKKSGKQNAEVYLRMCAEDGRIPKFARFLVNNGDGSYSLQPDGSTDGYWKLLGDFKMYNHKTGKGTPQRAVTPNFNMEEAERVLHDYEGGADTLPVAQDVVNDFVEEYKAEHPRKKYSLTVSDRQRDAEYMQAVESGDTERAQNMVDTAAAINFELSQVRSKEGKLLKMYHGTAADFNEFRRDKIGSTGRFEGSGFNFTPYEGRAASYGKNVLSGYLNIEHPLSADRKTISVPQLAKIIREADPTGDNIISNYARDTRDYGTSSFVRREAMVAARQIWDYSDNDVDIYSDISSADPDAEGLIEKFESLGYDGLIHYDDNGNIKTAVAFSSEQFKRADPVTYDDQGNVIPLSERFNTEKSDIRYSLDEEGARAGQEMWDRQQEYTGGESQVLQRLTGDLWTAIAQRKQQQKAENYGQWKVHVAEMARTIKSETNSNVFTEKQLEDRLTAILEEHEKMPHATREEAENAINNTLNELQGLIQEALSDQLMDEHYKEVKSALKNGIYINPDQVKELGGAAELRDFRNALSGFCRVYTSEKAANAARAMHLDGAGWEELQSIDPDVFNPGTHWLERAQALRDFVDLHTDSTMRDDPMTRDYIRSQALATLTEYYIGSNETDATKRTRDALKKANNKVSSLERQLQNEMKAQAAMADQLKAEKKASYEKLNQVQNEAFGDKTKLNQQLQEAQAQTKATSAELTQALKEQDRLRNELDAADNKAAYLENTVRLLKKQNKQNQEAAVRDDRRRNKAKADQRAKAVAARRNIKKVADTLKRMIAKPNTTDYVPLDKLLVLQELLESFQKNDRRKIDKTTEQWMRHIREMRASPNIYISNTFDEGFTKQMQEVCDILREKGTNNLDSQELQYVSNTFTEALHQIRNATTMIARKRNTDILKESASAIEANNANKGLSMKPFLRGAQKFTMEHLSPKRFFNMLAGYKENAWSRIGSELAEGQRKQERARQQMTDELRALTEGENAKKFDKFTGKNAELIDTGYKDQDGKKIYITPAQRVSLYLHSLNVDNLRHFIYGVTLPNQQLLKQGKKELAYEKSQTLKLVDWMHREGQLGLAGRSNDEMIAEAKAKIDELTKDMSEYEKAWIEAYRKLEEKSTRYINETSMQLNGYDKATVDNYFPIKTDKNFLQVDFESLVHNGTIEGMGPLKERIHGSNPMTIEDANDVIDRMVNNTSLYYGMAIPVRNFTKMYNGSVGMYDDSVKQSIQRVWGNEGKQYLERLMNDIQGNGRNEERTFLDDFRSKYAGAVLTLNPSVMMKQAASLPTAAASLGWRPIMKALGNAKKVDANLINKYTSAYIERANGGIRDMEANAQRNTALKRGLYRFGNGIQAVDLATVRKIWQAAEYYVQEQQPGLKQGTEEYYQAVARAYETALEDTQPEYGVMQRPHILRTKNQLLRSVLMFKTQSIQNFNILYDAAMNLRAKQAAYKEKQSAENKAQLDQAKTNLARAASSQIVSAVVLAVMTALGKALLHKPENYQDDKGEVTATSAAYQLSKDAISSMTGMMVGGSEIFDLIAGIAEGKKPFDIEANSLSLLNDIYQSVYKLGNAAGAIGDSSLTAEQKRDKLLKALKEFGLNVGAAYGIPGQNIWKIGESAVKYIDDITSGRGLEGLTTGDVTLTTAARYMGEALQSGDKDAFARLYNRLLTQGKTASQINSAMKSWMKTSDPRIQQAATAIDSGDIDTYNMLINQMTDAGYGMANVVTAIEAVRKAQSEEVESRSEEVENAPMTYDQIIEAQENAEASAYTYAQMNQLLDSGNTRAALQVQKALFKSKGTTAVKSALTSYWKPKYQEAYQNRNRTELNRITRLLKTMGYSDQSINKWKNVESSTTNTSSKKTGFGSGTFGSSFGKKSGSKKSSSRFGRRF